MKNQRGQVVLSLSVVVIALAFVAAVVTLALHGDIDGATAIAALTGLIGLVLGGQLGAVAGKATGRADTITEIHELNGNGGTPKG